MLDEILETAITMILDAMESFFNAMVYPTVKHLQTAIYTSMIFLLCSLISELFEDIVMIVSWQEALTCTIILFIIYGINSITQNDINKMSISIKEKATQAKHKVATTVKSATNKKGSKKPVTTKKKQKVKAKSK